MMQTPDSYLPQLAETSQPLYTRLADAIERDIDSGVLPAGSRLPPMRNLAYDIGVTIGTINRAYNLIAERGLVVGEVGRGTYVRDREKPVPFPTASTRLAAPPHKPAQHPVFDLGENNDAVMNLDTTSAIHAGQAKIIAEQFAEIAARQPEDQWLARADWRAHDYQSRLRG